MDTPRLINFILLVIVVVLFFLYPNDPDNWCN